VGAKGVKPDKPGHDSQKKFARRIEVIRWGEVPAFLSSSLGSRKKERRTPLFHGQQSQDKSRNITHEETKPKRWAGPTAGTLFPSQAQVGGCNAARGEKRKPRKGKKRGEVR